MAWRVGESGRRSRFNLPRSKAECESFAAFGMADRRFSARGHQLVAQLQPSPETRRRLRSRPRPAAASQRTFEAGEVRILPDMEKADARTLREGQFKVAPFGKP